MSEASTLYIDIVSAEAKLFSGVARMVVAPSMEGELGIMPRHAPLTALLSPGTIRVCHDGDNEEVFYVSGGVLEVQQELRPDATTVITVLADVAARAADLDEARAVEAKQRAEKALAEQGAKVDYAHAAAELAHAVAQLRAIQELRKKRKH